MTAATVTTVVFWRRWEDSVAVSRETSFENLPEILTAEEVAAWLNISVWSAYDLARRNELPCLRFGRTVRIQKRALTELVGRRPGILSNQK